MVHAPKCQSCGSALEKVLSLGFMPPVNLMQRAGEPLQAETWLPTELMRCHTCELVQLSHEADQRVVFPPGYAYTSGTTKILRDNFAQLAIEVHEHGYLTDHSDIVVDIGSNDGTLLSNFTPYRTIGFEPTDVAAIAAARGIETYKMFFGRDAAADLGLTRQAKVVTCCNCFAHIPDVNGVTAAIEQMLAPGGVFISESHYLPTLLRDLQYDTIYHEHLRYYSLTSLVNLLSQHGLVVAHARLIPTHGGSIRVYAMRASEYQFDRGDNDSVLKILKSEATGPNLSTELLQFAGRVRRARRDLQERIYSEQVFRQRIVGISAPSRASTVINYCRLDEHDIEYVCEVPGSLKIGKYMPGTAIPVVDEARLFEGKPECAVLFSWHIADEIVDKLRAKGYRGKIILPMKADAC